MKSATIIALGAACLLAPQSGWANETISLSPSSQWIVDFGTDRCMIARQFGSGKDVTTLKISTILPDWGYELTLIGRHARLSNWRGAPRGGEIGIAFSPGGPQAQAIMRTAETDSLPALIASGVFEEVPGSDDERHYLLGEPSRYAAIERIDFDNGMNDPLSLETGEMQRVFALMDECKWKQVASWGLDVDANRNRVSKAVLKTEYVTRVGDEVQETYPSRALLAGMAAQLSLRIIVDESGTATDCRVLSATRAEEFGNEPCAPFLAQPYLFQPAIGADGRPIASWAHLRINYFVP